MNNPPLKHVADKLSKHGRYGDTMLVHMNPREVEGIASLVPGGRLTINPVTGQPEAFLPFLIPMLGSWLGSAAAGAGMLGGLGTLAGSAIGSGLATTLATGDLEQGLISGITGFGMGSALSGLGGAAATDVATQAATTAGTTAATDAAALAATQAATDAATQTAVASQTAQAATGQNLAGMLPQPNVAQVAEFAGTGAPNSAIANYQSGAFNNAVIPNSSLANVDKGIGSLVPPKPTFTEGLMAPLRHPDDFLKNLAKTESFLPIYVGEGTNASIRAQEQMDREGKLFGQEEEGKRSAAKEGILRALERARTDYGMFAGGQVDYASGGGVDSETPSGGTMSAAAAKALNSFEPFADPYSTGELYGRYGSPSGIQSSLRGPVLNTPPAFDYNSLYSGGSGYAPGISPEFMFFSQPQPDTGGGTGDFGGGFGGGSGVDFGGGSGVDFGGGFVRGPNNYTGNIENDYFSPLSEFLREEMENRPIRKFAEGGPVDPAVEATVNPFQEEYNNLVQSTVSAIKGEIENPEPVINKFVEEYGQEAFMQLREQVLQGVQPGAQTQGLIDGPGGGMDDMVQGSISDGRPVAVSPGEYIIPADVVSAAGDGNTGGGAKFFDDLIESIRVSKNGTSEQPKPMKELMG